MFDKRRRFYDILDELDNLLADLEKDVENTLKDIYESRPKTFTKPMVYGLSMMVGPDGEPVLRTFGDKKLLEEGYREPVYDRFVNNEKGELKLVVELPGIEREDVELNVLQNEVCISAARGERKYRAKIPLEISIEPKSTSALYRNGILEVSFKAHDKTNKGYTKVQVS